MLNSVTVSVFFFFFFFLGLELGFSGGIVKAVHKLYAFIAENIEMRFIML